MKFTVDSKHKKFFSQKGSIEFEEFFSKEQCQQLLSHIQAALSTRFSVSTDKVKHKKAEEIFAQGRDLWRVDSALQKWTSNPKLVKITSELCEKSTLRLAYDQYFVGRELHTPSSYQDFLNQAASLQAISALTPLTCGILICVEEGKPPEVPEEELPEEGTQVLSLENVFPLKIGNIAFLSPERPLRLDHLQRLIGFSYYLIVFSQEKTLYTFNAQDPHGHELKKFGYVFGDRVKDQTHPSVLR